MPPFALRSFNYFNFTGVCAQNGFQSYLGVFRQAGGCLKNVSEAGDGDSADTVFGDLFGSFAEPES